nr:hypothetical protein OG296_43340 [Streptomyces sp. NBC_01001]
MRVRSRAVDLVKGVSGRIPMETVATALGTSERAVRRYVNGYLHP